MKKTVGCVLLLVFILSIASFAAPRNLGELKWAVKKFEKAVKYKFQSRSWKRRRRAWISAVNRANTPRKMARVIVTLETSMTWASVSSSWRTRRSSWISEARSARTVAKFARLLLELETKTKWSAVYRSWRRARSGWISRVRALM